MRLLQRLRPDVRVANLRVLAVEGEHVGPRPRLHDEVVRLVVPVAKFMSIDVPTGKPATRRPPDRRSSIANSSATRSGGLYAARLLPSTTIAARDVRRVSVAAMRFGDGISP